MKTIFLILIPILLVSCKYEANPKSQFKWAVVDKNKISNALADLFKKQNPYPPELADYESIASEERKTQNQIRQLKKEAEEKCMKDQKNLKKTEHSKNESLSGAEGQLEPYRMHELRAIGLSSAFLKAGIVDQQKFADCISVIENDPLIADLKKNLDKIDEIQKTKSHFDSDIRKKTDEYIKNMIARYGETNNFQVIVSTNYGSDSILYNADKVTLNVTDDIVDFILKNQSMSANSEQSIANK